MRFTTGRSTPIESPASCSYSTNLQHDCKSAQVHQLARRSRRPSRQPSGSGFSICAQQEAARETKKQTKAERPPEIAGRPVADNTPYEMPVVCLLCSLPETLCLSLLLSLFGKLSAISRMPTAADGLRADVTEGLHCGRHWSALGRIWCVLTANLSIAHAQVLYL